MCGFQTHQVSQATQAPIPAPNTVRGPTIACMKLISSYSLNRENDSRVILGPIMAKMNPKWIKIVLECINKHNSQHGENNSPSWETKQEKKTYTGCTREEDIDSQHVREGNLYQTPKYKGKTHPIPLCRKTWMTTDKWLPSWLHEIKQKRCLCMKNEERPVPTWGWTHNGDSWMGGEGALLPLSIVMERVESLPSFASFSQHEVPLLVESASGQGLTILPPPLPNNNCLNYSAKHLRW